MKEIKVQVPDNDCKDCDFLSCSYYGNSCKDYQEKYYCTIFKCDIERKQKCIACKMFAQSVKRDGEQ